MTHLESSKAARPPAPGVCADLAKPLLWSVLLVAIVCSIADRVGAQSIINVPALTQGPSDVLPIQIGGLTPGLEHDQYQVANDALLDGRIELQLINGYEPQPGEQIQLISASMLNGRFSSYLTPVALPPGVAIEFLSTNQALDLHFVAPTIGPSFVEGDALNNWTDGEIWSGSQQPGSTDVIQLTNAFPANNQVVQVLPLASGGGPAQTHSLTVSGVGPSQMTLRVFGDASLSATQAITIGSQGRVQVLGGTVTAQSANVLQDGVLDINSGQLLTGGEGITVQGRLYGSGSIVGDVVTAGGGEVLPGPESGATTGVLGISGSYTQQSGATLQLDVNAAVPGGHDGLAVSGLASLEGDLAIDFAPGSVALGDEIEVLTAGQITPSSRFNRVDSSGLSPGLYAAPKFDENLVTVSITSVGDMDADGGEIDADDIDLFVLALRSREAYFNFDAGNGPLGIVADISGDADMDGDLDFDDIDDLINLLPPPTALFAKQRLLGVPEPSSFLMAVSLSMTCLLQTSRRG